MKRKTVLFPLFNTFLQHYPHLPLLKNPALKNKVAIFTPHEIQYLVFAIPKKRMDPSMNIGLPLLEGGERSVWDNDSPERRHPPPAPNEIILCCYLDSCYQPWFWWGVNISQ
ncbi:hypothetical protein CEXT_792861 [Caerostris extrusa]|uniref:Uncharacterized protein n=1 Tax=Caerostris extrusa TaxID=172846 RepID=A0AAV4MKT3_CAEEX|nr:hypothetical protein CEXT_792861 [Caerostris extrusa]